VGKRGIHTNAEKQLMNMQGGVCSSSLQLSHQVYIQSKILHTQCDMLLRLLRDDDLLIHCHTCLWHPLVDQSLHRGWQSSQHKQCSSMETAVRNKHTATILCTWETCAFVIFQSCRVCLVILHKVCSNNSTAAISLVRSIPQPCKCFLKKLQILQLFQEECISHWLPSYMDLKCGLYLQFLIACKYAKMEGEIAWGIWSCDMRHGWCHQSNL